LKGGVTTTFTYNAENKLTQVNIGGTPTASFVYDGDGTRVASTINGVTTKFVGEYYEVTGTEVTKYYGGKTAMWTTTGGLTYLLADHLGSNSLITSGAGTLLSETRYKPWGEIRYSTGTTTTPYSYTGQYSNTADFGWMYYKARWYDSTLGRFAQPDSIVPGAGDPRAWDRYSYVKNNPVNFSDPSGHCLDGATTILCIAMGVGALIGYGAQVYDNMNQGMDFGEALITNISGEEILLGALIGGGVVIGAAAISLGLSAIGLTAGFACADGDCGNEIQLSAKLGQDAWKMDNLTRGKIIESAIGRSPQRVQNFPTIDRFENGIATSIKSIDLTAKSYQSVETLTRTVQGYINALANWQGARWGGVTIQANQIAGRELILAIPPNASQAQLQSLQQLQQWALDQGVTLTLTTVK
jgi:RHS repeat-associated protein